MLPIVDTPLIKALEKGHTLPMFDGKYFETLERAVTSSLSSRRKGTEPTELLERINEKQVELKEDDEKQVLANY
eukprot:snap_masked-scaffold_7-processed-gene-19.16-mRNA-1 protein AED:1.00 eAED:1.00 QI:0/-1/0/0/-1/1/1/0/73